MEEKRYIKKKEKARLEGNWESFAFSCHNLGDFYNQHGKYHDAVKEYQQEANLYKKLGKELEMAKAKRMIGEMFTLLCEFDSAKAHIDEYLKIVKKLHNKVEEQRAYATLGRVHLLHGQSLSETSASRSLEELKQAEKAFLRSLLLTKDLTGHITKLEQFDMQARCYLNIGVVKEHMGEFEESITYIEKAIKISKVHDLYELTHLCYISMSLLYTCKKNDSTAALRYCNMALEVAKRLPDKVKKICETLITKADILIKVGDFASVKQILTKAYKKNTPDENDRNQIEKTLRIAVKICQTFDELVTTSSVDYAARKKLYEKLGDGCCHLGNYDKALEYYQKMLECAELNNESGKSLVPIYVSLYQTYKDNRQYDMALNYLWKEYEINKGEPVEAFTTLCSIAEICELQGQPFWTIQDIYQKARVQATKAGKSRNKLLKIVMLRLKKLQLKHGMDAMANDLAEEAKTEGITLEDSENEDDYPDSPAVQQNTPDWDDDVCLDNLTDSDASDLDETEKPRLHRPTRGARSSTFKRNNKGETPLHQACIAGNLELARRLIDQGHTVNVRDHAGWLPLHEACNHGYSDIVELLLDAGALAAINDKGGTSCDGITPLYDACSNGYLQVVELLLERGADATVKTDYGETCVDGLDKWRMTAKLTEGEQAHYVQIRTALANRLSKIGINSKNMSQPLTNGNTSSNMCEDSGSNNSDCESDKELDLVSERQLYNNRSRLNESGKSTKKTCKSSARDEYKNVMETLKHPKRQHVYNSAEDNSPTEKRNALFDENEVDADNWLIDDIGPERKKRRHNVGSRTETSGSTDNFVEVTHFPRRDTIEMNCSPVASSLEDLLDENKSYKSQQQQQPQKKRLSLSLPLSASNNSSSQSNSSKSRVINKKRKSQLSLLDRGFSRISSKSPTNFSNDEDSLDCASVVNFRTSDTESTSIQLLISPSKSSPINVQATSIVSTSVSFKVKIENELLLVPIERKKLNEIKIRWLAEEAARRYYNLIGLKPVLRLKTSDGFAYEEDDPVNVAIEQNMILGSVLEWIISPLVQRYEEMCNQLKKDVNLEIRAAMEQAQSSNSIELADFWLRAGQTEPIFKALIHQTRLHTVDLSNNFIQNVGCYQLAKSLPTLAQLKILNLKNNFITSEGIEALLSAIIEKPNQVEEFNFSQNPLGNSCLSILEKYATHTVSKLRRLYVSQCEFTNLGTFDLAYSQLVSFDISYNCLSIESIRFCLSKLNSSRLQNLNLSYILSPQSSNTIDDNFLGDNIVSFLENGTCEKFERLELCGCQLSDTHMYKIVECLSKANELQLFDVSENTWLGSSSLQFIFDKVPQLRKLIATNCSHFIKNICVDRFEQRTHFLQLLKVTIDRNLMDSQEYQSLSNLWNTCWKDKAKIKTFGKQIFFYINEKDL